MANPVKTRLVKLGGALLAAGLLLGAAPSAWAQDVPRVTTYQDEQGWKLRVDGEDFFVKGVVWSYTPRGVNYSYNTWGQSEDFIKQMLDQEMTLLKDANINAIRTFSNIPPKWITYIYEQYGIMSLVNPLFGRYGATINGTWVPNTNYQDPVTRETLINEFVEVVKQYKDVPGVLMFALGNESNYGLSWASFEIENLPVGEQHREKARFLYSLFDEAIDAGREIAPDHLYTIVNGDIQYIDLIAEYGGDWDLLGVNSYRGISFEDPANNVSLWQDVQDRYGKAVVFMEFGSDAFNAREFVEDQPSQAQFLRGQWQEMYNKSYGKGEQGNSIGGFVFQWRDEWWKYRQTENLDIHDPTASWENGGYFFDHVEGQNNMNEEWFGITRLGEQDSNGIYVSEPRAAYYVLKDVWSIDIHNASRQDIDEAFRNLDTDLYGIKGELDALNSEFRSNSRFRLTGGDIQGEYLVQGKDGDLGERGEDGLVWQDGLMANLDFAFQPSKQLSGSFRLNILANVAESDFLFRYGDRGLPVEVVVFDDNGAEASITTTEVLEDRERVEIYNFNANYEGEDFDMEAFYHVPRYHWKYKGDFYGLLRETTDMEGQDIWNAKAPYGVEFTNISGVRGLTILAGPEVYWGANPLAMVKYDFRAGGADYTFIHSEDVAQADNSSGGAEATDPQSRQTTIYGKYNLGSIAELQLGGLWSGSEKVGDSYDRLEGDDIVIDEIEDKDTLGFKANLAFNLPSARAYVAAEYAGLVADGGDTLREFGTELPYSDLGNKQVLEGGVLFNLAPFTIYPRVLVRENLVDANPSIDPSTTGSTLSPGLEPRNLDSDPFAVLGNREAQAAEIMLTYDPTPGTSFYHWDVDHTEDASFAFNIGLNYTEFDTDTDSYRFFFEEGGSNAPFGEGLVEDDVWMLRSKMIFNPDPSARYIVNLAGGQQQSTGKPGEETVEYHSIGGKVIVGGRHIYHVNYVKDGFGPFDFYRQFNLVYPRQVDLEYALLLDRKLDEDSSSKIGIRLSYRELDELSPAEEYDDGENEYMYELQTYFKYSF